MNVKQAYRIGLQNAIIYLAMINQILDRSAYQLLTKKLIIKYVVTTC